MVNGGFQIGKSHSPLNRDEKNKNKNNEKGSNNNSFVIA
jgi:hypothetical protein